VSQLKIAFPYLAVISGLFVLTFAEIDGGPSPFAIAFLFASVYLARNAFVGAGAAFVFSLFTQTSQQEVIANLFAVTLFIIFAQIFKKQKQKLGKLDIFAVIFAYILANLLHIFNAEMLYRELVSVLIGAIFVFCSVILINTALLRGGRIPWTIDQKICLSVFVVVVALGLGGLEHDYFSTHKFITILVILVGVFYYSPKGTLLVAICMGLGRSFVALNLNFVAIYALLCAVVIGFKNERPYIAIVALIFADLVLGTYFNAYWVYDIFSLIPIFLAIACFLVLPKQLLMLNVYHLNSNLIGKNTINQNRAVVYGRLSMLSNVFLEISTAYRKLTTPTLSKDMVAQMIVDSVQSQICANCPGFPDCKGTAGDDSMVTSSMLKLCTTGMHRGSVNFLDAPSTLGVKCSRLGTVLSLINETLSEFYKKQARNKTLDEGKVLAATMLGGVAGLCQNLAGELGRNLVFENAHAVRVKEDLLYKSIVALDCLITKSNMSEYTCSILLARKDMDNPEIAKVISKVCGHKMSHDLTQDAETAGYAIVTYRTAPRYAVVYGVAQVAKNHARMNGDVFSFLKIDNEKTLVAICDGMGTGEAAATASTLALSLVENFYRANFTHEIIIHGVNQLLSITGGEIFSALDTAVFNLATGGVDFIKVGGADGYIKRERDVELVEAGSLPLGVLESVKPKMAHAVLASGDFVVLLSDGILEAFASDRIGLGNFINNLAGENPQKLADEIMQEALNRGGVARDDYTVVAVKIV